VVGHFTKDNEDMQKLETSFVASARKECRIEGGFGKCVATGLVFI
jgi:hypothetical protein